MSIHQVNVAFAGLTAAGKMTHADMLATDLHYELVEAAPMIQRLLDIHDDGPAETWWIRNLAESERRREGDHVDDILETVLVDLASTKEGQVFDTWALPWIYSGPMVRIYLRSDLPSRTRKAYVSQGPTPALSLDQCTELIASKDVSTRQRFLRRHQFDLYRDYSSFDAVLDNSTLIESPTREAADLGIATFHPFVRALSTLFMRDDPSGLIELNTRNPNQFAVIVVRIAHRAFNYPEVA